MLTSGVIGDDLVGLLGLSANAPGAQAALEQFAHGMQPELDSDDDEAFVDWVTVNEIGLEFGFEDEAYVRAQDIAMRRQGPLLLTQLYFYGDTPKTRPFPYPLPFGLAFTDDRASVRRKLAAYEDLRRTYVRDAWRLPDFDLTIAYRQMMAASNRCFATCVTRRGQLPSASLNWSRRSLQMRSPECSARVGRARCCERTGAAGIRRRAARCASEHNADLRMSHGIEFGFSPGVQVPPSIPEFPEATGTGERYLTMVLGCTMRTSGSVRCPWASRSDDSQTRIVERVGREPDERRGLRFRNGFVYLALRIQTASAPNTAISRTACYA